MYTGQNEHEPHEKRSKRSSNGKRTCLNGHVTDETGINTGQFMLINTDPKQVYLSLDQRCLALKAGSYTTVHCTNILFN